MAGRIHPLTGQVHDGYITPVSPVGGSTDLDLYPCRTKSRSRSISRSWRATWEAPHIAIVIFIVFIVAGAAITAIILTGPLKKEGMTTTTMATATTKTTRTTQPPTQPTSGPPTRPPTQPPTRRTTQPPPRPTTQPPPGPTTQAPPRPTTQPPPGPPTQPPTRPPGTTLPTRQPFSLPEAILRLEFNISMLDVLYDMCWMDEQTLVIAVRVSQQVIKYKFQNLETEPSMTLMNIPDNQSPFQVACLPPSTVYVQYSDGSQVFNISIFEGDELATTWGPDELTFEQTIAVSENLIVLSPGLGGFINVYHRSNRTLWYRRAFSDGLLLFTILTPGGHLVASRTPFNDTVLFFDLSQPESEFVVRGGNGSGDGQFIYSAGVAALHDGRVLVGDFGNSRIHVYTELGQFLGYVDTGDVDIGTLGPLALAAYSQPGEPEILSIGKLLVTNVQVFTLQ